MITLSCTSFIFIPNAQCTMGYNMSTMLTSELNIQGSFCVCAQERLCYSVTPSLIGCVHTENDPWIPTDQWDPVTYHMLGRLIVISTILCNCTMNPYWNFSKFIGCFTLLIIVLEIIMLYINLLKTCQWFNHTAPQQNQVHTYWTRGVFQLTIHWGYPAKRALSAMRKHGG